jgi:hypothetical protein
MQPQDTGPTVTESWPIHLLATNEDPTTDQVRLFWNCKDNDVDDLADRCPSIWLGDSHGGAAAPGAPQGPADRVHALVFLRGTTPDYVLPELSDNLIAEILSVFQPQSSDGMPSNCTMELTAFLNRYRGWRCFT